jgi:central glycolytic genes regulator
MSGEMTKDSLSTISSIAPEVQELIERRYTVLQAVNSAQPIGRRPLADRLGWPERTVRTEIDFLRHSGFLDSLTTGVTVSSTGMEVLEELKEIIRDLRGLMDLESKLAERLKLTRVYVVPGDSDTTESVKEEMARIAAQHLLSVLRPGDTLAVSGGSTVAKVADHLPQNRQPYDLMVVPTGGGLGDTLEIEANTVAARVARNLGANYRLLHMPDDLDEEAVTILSAEPSIKELFTLIRSARIVVQGIGTLEVVARRRRFTNEHTARLSAAGAVGETLGCYFDIGGNLVYSTSSVGLRLRDLENVEQVVAVAGGHSKAEAMLAVLSTHYQDVLVTDEAAARAVLSLLENTGLRTA